MEGSKLRTAGEEGLLGTLSGNYGLDRNGIPKVAGVNRGEDELGRARDEGSAWIIRKHVAAGGRQ